MRTYIKKLSFVALLLLLPIMVMANKEVPSARTSGEVKIRNVVASKQLRINYRYGEMELVFWDKNEILVLYEEVVEASSKKLADDVLQNRYPITRENSNEYVIEQLQNAYNSPHIVKYNSKWTVYVPVCLRYVLAKNVFGNINVGKGCQSQLRLEVEHGNVNVTDVKPMCMIKVTHGNFYVGKCGYMNVTTKHSNGTIGYANTLNLSSEHADAIRIDKVDNMTIQGRFNKLHINKMGEAKIKGSYFTIEIDELLGHANLDNMEHSAINVNSLIGKYDASALSHCKLNITINKNNRTPKVWIHHVKWTDVVVSMPNALKVSCLLHNSYGKINLDLPPSVKRYEIDREDNRFELRTHTQLNTSSFTPNSVIDVCDSSYGSITIKGY